MLLQVTSCERSNPSRPALSKIGGFFFFFFVFNIYIQYIVGNKSLRFRHLCAYDDNPSVKCTRCRDYKCKRETRLILKHLDTSVKRYREMFTNGATMQTIVCENAYKYSVTDSCVCVCVCRDIHIQLFFTKGRIIKILRVESFLSPKRIYLHVTSIFINSYILFY